MKRLLKKFEKRIGFGGASISGEGGGYGFGHITEDDSLRLLRHAFERGIQVFDTAPIYGFGISEERIGKAFAQNREHVFLISKSGVSWHENKRVNMTNDPKETQKMLESSLRRLRSDYIDLYMIHWPDKNVDIRRPMEVLAKAKQKGQIKSIGLCNTFYEDFVKAKEIDRIEVVQSEFNFFERENESLFSWLTEESISFMSWGTLDKGLLSGRAHKLRKFDSQDCRSWAPWWKKSAKDEKWKFVENLLESRGFSKLDLLKLALGFNFSHEIIDILLVGCRSEKQLDQIIELADSYKREEWKEFHDEL